MSEESVKTVRDLLTALAGRDMVAILRDTEPALLRDMLAAGYDPEIEVIWVDTSPDSAPYHGYDGLLRAMTDWLESFEEFYFEPEEFIDAGDDVVVPTAQKGRGKGSGAAVEMTATSVYTVRNGKIRSWREYSTKARALEAIGRSE
jgi:ketosteroid isomerase-like protein